NLFAEKAYNLKASFPRGLLNCENFVVIRYHFPAIRYEAGGCSPIWGSPYREPYRIFFPVNS
ncbi:TPA: hypothetical protein ACHKGF_005210, partial [Escherichia coli]